MKLLLSTVLSAFVLSAVSASIAPNSVVQLQLTVNTDLCLTSTNTTIGSQLTLDSCDSALTTFNLPRGAPTTPTQLALNATFSSGGPIACVSASGLDVDGPLHLDVCEDDDFQRWSVEGETGKGPIIINAGIGQVYCLTASGTEAGSAITYTACGNNGVGQEWSPVVV